MNVPRKPPRTFDAILNEVEPDQEAFERERASKPPAKITYMIIFTGRSGSSWLGSVLRSTGCLGVPKEYLNPNFLAGVARSTKANTREDILDMLGRRRQSQNGVFGLKVTSSHIRVFGETQFFSIMSGHKAAFNLWRDNIVAQGVSLYRAVETQKYNSRKSEAKPLPEYDSAIVRRYINQLLNVENGNIEMLSRNGVSAHFLRYEDIVRDRDTTLRLFADLMGVQLKIEAAEPSSAILTKVRDDWNADVEARFRKDEPNFVRKLDSRRLIKAAS